MDRTTDNQIVSFIWGIADDVLRDVYVRGKYRDVILPMTVLRRLDTLLDAAKFKELKPRLEKMADAHEPKLKPMARKQFLDPKTWKADADLHAFAKDLQADLGADRQIERMQEYRTALIAEAVTGKIDVKVAS